MSRNPLQAQLIKIIEPVVQANKLELVDVRFLLEQEGWTLRVQIDVPVETITDVHEVPSERVSLLDCEDMSRELSAVLDVEDPIKQAYSLEVSSPGIDRPLRTAGHFKHFAGSDAKIKLGVPLQLPTGERANFRGILKSATDTHVTIECDGQAFDLAIDDIDSAKLVPDWDAVMKGKSGVGSPLPKPIKPGHRPRTDKAKQKH